MKNIHVILTQFCRTSQFRIIKILISIDWLILSIIYNHVNNQTLNLFLSHNIHTEVRIFTRIHSFLHYRNKTNITMA